MRRKKTNPDFRVNLMEEKNTLRLSLNLDGKYHYVDYIFLGGKPTKRLRKLALGLMFEKIGERIKRL